MKIIHKVIFLILLITLFPLSSLAEKNSSDVPEKTEQEIKKEEMEQKAAEEKARFMSLLESKSKELLELLNYAEKHEKKIKEQLAIIRENSELLRQQHQRSIAMAKMVKGSPYETKAILSDLKENKQKLLENIKPLEKIYENIQINLDSIELLVKELDRSWAAGLERELKGDAREIRGTMWTAKKKLTLLHSSLGKELEQHNKHIEGINIDIKGLEDELPGFWKKILLTPNEELFDSAAWDKFREHLQAWEKGFPVYMDSQLPDTNKEWLDFGGKFFLFWFMSFSLALLLINKIAIIKDNISKDQKWAMIWAWFWTSIALGVLGSFLTSVYKQTSIQLALVHIFLFYGILRISWLFRILFEKDYNSKSALLPLFFIFSGAAILQFLNLPETALGSAWIIFLVAGFWTSSIQKSSLIFEKIVCFFTPLLCAGMIIATFFGWAQITMLISQVWALCMLAVELALGMSNTLRQATSKMPSSGFYPVLQGVIVGFGAPVIWLLSLAGVLAWLTIHFGSDFAYRNLSQIEFSWGKFSVNFLRVIGAVSLFYLTKSASSILNSLLDPKQVAWKKIDPGVANTLQTVGGYSLWILFGLIMLNMLGISLTSLTVVAGGLSVGIGFGMQNMINNFISGMILLFGRTIQAGDIIQLDDIWGTIKKVNIRNTEVQTFDNSMIFVPNSDLIAGKVTNWTHKRDFRIRRDVSVGVAYGSDVQKVKELLMEVAKEHKHILSYPGPTVLFTSFGDSSLDFILRFWIDNIDSSIITLSDVHEAIDQKFREANIEIPFPQRDVHMLTPDNQDQTPGS